jgi:cold shock CspA family protein
MYTVLWFDIRDGYGIATDDNGNEYYIDSSCCPADLKHGEKITGTVKQHDKTCIGLIMVKRA